MNIFKKILTFIILATFVFGAGFFAGSSHKKSSDIYDFAIPSIFKSEKVDFSLIKDVWDIIHRDYVNADEINDEALIYAAIRGMLRELGDPYSTFFDKEETSEFVDSVTGKYEGVGIEITLKDDKLTIVSPLKESPALRAGLRAGDTIVAINGETTKDITLEEAITQIRGPKGTSVELTVIREEGGKEIGITVIRDTIEAPSIKWEIIEDNIAYIEILQFSDNTDEDFKKAVQEILTTPADRIIVDLRNNPGGFLETATSIAGWFLQKDEIIVIEERQRDIKRIHRSQGPGLLGDFPIVILQNGGSASASEILAGALRDHKNTPLVGEKTFGKGLVQEFKDLPGGSSIKLTIAKWITPSGQYINDEGIEPTISIELSEEDFQSGNDTQKQKAIEVIRSMR
ncbi:MAG: S41 family peptidase [Candidatus Spechtbacterales bacterium]